MTFYQLYMNSVAIVVLAITCGLLTFALRNQRQTLNRVRTATYVLTKADREDIEDLQDALKAAGIPLPRPRMKERMRRLALTPEEREAESIARFNEAVAETERQQRKHD